MVCFKEFITEKNEKICVNLACIILAVETKRGILIQTSDGDTFSCLTKYDEFVELVSSDSKTRKNVENVEKGINDNDSFSMKKQNGSGLVRGA